MSIGSNPEGALKAIGTPPVAAALVAGGLLTLIPASLGAAMLARTPRLK